MPVRRAILVAVAARRRVLSSSAAMPPTRRGRIPTVSKTQQITASDLPSRIAQTSPSAIKTGSGQASIRREWRPRNHPGDPSAALDLHRDRIPQTLTSPPAEHSKSRDRSRVQLTTQRSFSIFALGHCRRKRAHDSELRVHFYRLLSQIALGEPLEPGKTVNVELTVSMPATITNSQGKTVDVAVELLKYRSANTSTHQVFTMKNSAKLKQAGRS